MEKYKIQTARTEADVKGAYELFYKSFGPSYYEAKEVFDLTHTYDKTIKKENIFVIKINGCVVAATRIVERKLNLFGENLKIGGIATNAVMPLYRGGFLFHALTTHVLQEMVARKFEMCLVFARRALDNFYVPYGFWGTPVERRFTLLEDPSPPNGQLFFREVQERDILFLEDLYRKVYSRFSVFLERPDYLWQLKFKINAISKHFIMYVCSKTVDDNPIGYVICEKGKGVIEICAEENDPNLYAAILFSTHSPVRETALNHISLSLEHPISRQLKNYSHSFFTRHATNGGNLLKILDPYDGKSNISKLLRERLRCKGSKISRDALKSSDAEVSRVLTAAFFGYEVPETPEVFGETQLRRAQKEVDFIFSPLDDF